MARVTVEDCILKVPNRFELCMVSAQRARRIGAGAALTVERDNDKNPVISLREIADETVSVEDLKEELVKSHQRIFALQDDKDDVIEEMQGEEEWNSLVAAANNTGFAAGEFDDEEEEESPLEDMAGMPEEE